MNETARKQAATICLLSLAAVSLYLCYLIARPFLGPIVIALMLAIVFYPLHSRTQRYVQSPSAAAALATTLVLLIVTIPIVLLGISVGGELRGVVQSLREQSSSQGSLSPFLSHLGESLMKRLGNYVNLSQLDPHAILLRWAEQASRSLFSVGATVVTNLVSFVMDSVVAFFSLFFFFSRREKHSARIIGNTAAEH
jgi:predicted PurR-regulated permease PerM